MELFSNDAFFGENNSGVFSDFFDTCVFGQKFYLFEE